MVGEAFFSFRTSFSPVAGTGTTAQCLGRTTPLVWDPICHAGGMQVKYLSANATKAAGLPMSLLISLAATSVLLNAGNRSCQNKLLPLWLMHRVTTENLGNSQGNGGSNTFQMVGISMENHLVDTCVCVYEMETSKKNTVQRSQEIHYQLAITR